MKNITGVLIPANDEPFMVLIEDSPQAYRSAVGGDYSVEPFAEGIEIIHHHDANEQPQANGMRGALLFIGAGGKTMKNADAFAIMKLFKRKKARRN